MPARYFSRLRFPTPSSIIEKAPTTTTPTHSIVRRAKISTMAPRLFLVLIATTFASSCLAEDTSPQRELQAAFDFFDLTKDLCDNGEDTDGPAVLGPCNSNKFPVCEDGKSQICYNRKPSRDHFYPDSHQPVYYIQYDRVFCYPNNFEGCSSCTPGRYCKSEERCIMEELDYECAQWY